MSRAAAKPLLSRLLAGLVMLCAAGALQAGPGQARVSASVAERAARHQPVDVLIVMDDTVQQQQLRSMVGPLGVDRREGRDHERRVLQTRRQLMAALKDDVLLAASEPDLELLADYDNLPIVHARIRSARALQNLRRQGRIKSIDAVLQVRPTLAESLPLINQPAMQALGHTGAGTTVAVLDTGVDFTRAAFGSCGAPGGSCKVAVAQEFATPDGQRDSGNYHGTNVAGIVLGVAPGARIAALDVFESNGLAYSNVIINAINWCISNRATYNIAAINMSLGGGRYYAALAPTDAWGTAIANAVAAGIVVVAASGNDGYTNSMGSPAAYSNVVSVGAFYDAGGQVNQVTSFSNSASFLTMVAPGSMITAAGIAMQGTSQATPHVAGAAAVLKATYPNDTVAQLITKLKLGANLSDSRNGIAKPRLDLQASLAVPPATYRLTVSKTGSGTGTVTSSAGGLNCGNTCVADITNGDSVTLTALHGPGSQFTGWSGACSGSGVSCTLAMSVARSVGAGFVASTGEDMLPGGLLPGGWGQASGSDAPWAPTTGSPYVGTHALKAATIAHGQKAGVSVTGNFRAGTVSFARRVSSEAGQDLMKFYIDGNLHGSWSGEVAWGMVSFPVSAGEHTLSWVYEKSGSGSAGSDTAWIDSVNLPLAATDRTQSANDFDGDGRADILWRNAGTGANTLWLMDSTVRLSGSGAAPATSDLNWRLVGRGDFNDDGKADLLWRHAVDGRNAIWFMDGVARLGSSGSLDTLADLNWQVAGVGDFNGDGKADILWRHAATGANALWLMDGLTKLPGSGQTAAVSDLNWRVVGVADFNGDGRADILWRHMGSGNNTLWLMDGLTRTTYGAIVALADLRWAIVGAADFDADGKSDILWRNTGDGRNSIWLMDGLTRRSSTALQAVTDLNFKVAGLGDFNGDGRNDIFWRHATSGKNILWQMDGTTRLNLPTDMTALTDVRWVAVSPKANPH